MSVLTGLQGLWEVRAALTKNVARLMRFIVPGLLGVPVGVALLAVMNADALRLIVATLLIVYGGLIVYAYWPYGDGIPVADLAGPDDRFVDVNGIQLLYKTWGQSRPGEPALVFIHGFANSLQSFNRIAPLLADDYQVIALDMP